MSRGLVDKYQCTVMFFPSRFKDCAAEEMIDGVWYIRRGNEVTVHLRGFLYALKNRKKFNRIIDEFNGIGFFTFFLPNSILLIHQLYKEFWLRELGLPGILPFILEPMLLRLYRKKATITISHSTKEDLEHMGFRDVSIVMIAIKHFPLDDSVKKNNDPTLIFLGRLKSTKRPQDAIEIFKRVKEKIPTVRLWITGRGPEEEKLKMIAKEIDGITFWGWVDEEKKMLLLRQSHLLLVPSVREGFGINVIEAASTGTPAIGYDVHGLRDSIRHGETGYLVNSTDEAALRILELLGDKKRYEKMSSNCLYYSKEFDWDMRVDEFWHKICF